MYPTFFILRKTSLNVVDVEIEWVLNDNAGNDSDFK